MCLSQTQHNNVEIDCYSLKASMYIIEEFSQLANQELFPISIMQLQFILLSFNYSRLNAVEQSTNLFLQPDNLYAEN